MCVRACVCVCVFCAVCVCVCVCVLCSVLLPCNMPCGVGGALLYVTCMCLCVCGCGGLQRYRTTEAFQCPNPHEKPSIFHRFPPSLCPSFVCSICAVRVPSLHCKSMHPNGVFHSYNNLLPPSLLHFWWQYNATGCKVGVGVVTSSLTISSFVTMH